MAIDFMDALSNPNSDWDSHRKRDVRALGSRLAQIRRSPIQPSHSPIHDKPWRICAQGITGAGLRKGCLWLGLKVGFRLL